MSEHEKKPKPVKGSFTGIYSLKNLSEVVHRLERRYTVPGILRSTISCRSVGAATENEKINQ
jgi:hypothetical protein